jgi:Phosphatidylethanolamine-binding protein
MQLIISYLNQVIQSECWTGDLENVNSQLKANGSNCFHYSRNDRKNVNLFSQSPMKVQVTGFVPDTINQKWYSVYMVDLIGEEKRIFHHWLVVNCPMLEDGMIEVSKGITVMRYHPPTPPGGTGLHRYIYVVFEQKNGLIEGGEEDVERNQFDIYSWIRSHNVQRFCQTFMFFCPV